jgi:hypothetical protein
MIFGNFISVIIYLLFINLQDGTCIPNLSGDSHTHSLQSRQSGLGSKGGGGDLGGCKTYMMMGQVLFD